jgi:hypothetical protein
MVGVNIASLGGACGVAARRLLVNSGDEAVAVPWATSFSPTSGSCIAAAGIGLPHNLSRQNRLTCATTYLCARERQSRENCASEGRATEVCTS